MNDLLVLNGSTRKRSIITIAVLTTGLLLAALLWHRFVVAKLAAYTTTPRGARSRTQIARLTPSLVFEITALVEAAAYAMTVSTTRRTVYIMPMAPSLTSDRAVVRKPVA